MSSRGEMKISLREMTYFSINSMKLEKEAWSSTCAYIFVSEVLQKLQLAICSLCENGSAERFHNFFDSDILVCELISGRAIDRLWVRDLKSKRYGGIQYRAY
jgi:hypothetical protein